MTKKILAFLLTVCLAVSIVGVSSASFIYAVFEYTEEFEFEVEFDAMDDTGRVTFPEDFQPFGSATSSGDMVAASLDLLGIPDAAVVIRAQFLVVGSWPKVARIIFLPDKTRYTVKAISNQESRDGTLLEAATIAVVPALMPMFEEIINKQITSVQYRLDSDDNDHDIDGAISVNFERLKWLLEFYDAAGGMRQDFASLDTMFPVAVE